MQRWLAASEHEVIPFPFANVIAGLGLGGALGAAELEAILRISDMSNLGTCDPGATLDDLRALMVGVVADGERVVLQRILSPDRRIRQAHINDWTVDYKRPGAHRESPWDWDYGWQGDMEESPVICATLGSKEEWFFIAPWLDVAQFEHIFQKANHIELDLHL